MILARVLVGLIAAIICIAGLGWYAVYLFAPDPQRSSTPTPPASPMRLHPEYARRQNKRSVISGVAAVLAGLALTPTALDSIRTGVPVHTLNGPAINGWIFLAMVAFVAVLGMWLAVSALFKMGNAPDRQD